MLALAFGIFGSPRTLRAVPQPCLESRLFGVLRDVQIDLPNRPSLHDGTLGTTTELISRVRPLTHGV